MRICTSIRKYRTYLIDFITSLYTSDVIDSRKIDPESNKDDHRDYSHIKSTKYLSFLLCPFMSNDMTMHSIQIDNIQSINENVFGIEPWLPSPSLLFILSNVHLKLHSHFHFHFHSHFYFHFHFHFHFQDFFKSK